MTVNLPAFQPTLEETKALIILALLCLVGLVVAVRLRVWGDKATDDWTRSGRHYAAFWTLVGAAVLFILWLSFAIEAFWPNTGVCP